MRILILVAFVALTGCTTYAQRVANTCAQLGMPRGSPDYAGCVHDQVVTDQADRAMWGQTTAVGASLLYQPPTYVVVH